MNEFTCLTVCSHSDNPSSIKYTDSGWCKSMRNSYEHLVHESKCDNHADLPVLYLMIGNRNP